MAIKAKFFIFLTLFFIVLTSLSCSNNQDLKEGFCTQDPQYKQNEIVNSPVLTGDWGNGLGNTRYQPMDRAGLSKEDIPQLKLKWAFKLPNTKAPRSQPAITTDTVYVGGEKGHLFALDKSSGCIKWHRQFEDEVRTAMVIADVSSKLRLLFFGDDNAVMHALNAQTGEDVWHKKMDSHDSALITAAPNYHQGRLFVSVSSLEVITALNPLYQCCTFRGSVAALDVKTGEIIWQTYTVAEEAGKTSKNKVGIRQWGPSGAPVWNTPAIDVKRNRLYVGTGENYTTPATSLSDSVIAMDLDDGKIIWSKQLTPGDAWNLSCAAPLKLSCPEKFGLDLDIGAAIMLLTRPDGEDILIAGQKSGKVFALNPETNGDIVWQQKLGRGGALGGVHWGMAADEQTVFVPISDMDLNMMIFNAKNPEGEKEPGLNAVDMATGKLKWRYQQTFTCKKPSDCDTGMSTPPTVMPGVVFATNLDGEILAFSSEKGQLLWSYDTTQKVKTVSGEMAHGGTIDVAGPVIAGGQVFIQSGYKMGTGGPGNVFLSFSVDGK